MPKKAGLAESIPKLTADTITKELRKNILNGNLPVGLQLKQESLAARFNVSRFPIRQALKQLETEGLLTHTPFAGSVVASRSATDLIEILDIRIALETHALGLAIPNMRSVDFSEVKAIMARYDGSENPREWADLNIQFHLRLYQPCHRPKLLQMVEDLVRSVDIQMRAQQSYRLGRKSPQTEHRAIAAACKAKDAATAMTLLRQHIEHTQAALRDAPNLA